MNDSTITRKVLGVLEWTWEMRDDVLSGELEPQRYVDTLKESLNNPAYCKESHSIILDALEEMKPPYDETIYKIKMDYEMRETRGWLESTHNEYREGYITASRFEERLEQTLKREIYPEVRDMIKEFSDNVAYIFVEYKLENEWADMPSDDTGTSAEETIRSLRDYNISFFPVRQGYYFEKKISGIRYEVRSSFALEGKSLESILEDTIVGRAMDCHQEYAD
nr:hypothetical protein [uncultured Acetatifactor sp.]